MVGCARMRVLLASRNDAAITSCLGDPPKVRDM